MNLFNKKLCIGACVLLFFGCSKINPNDNEKEYLARVGSHYLTIDEARRQVNDFALQQDSIAALENFRQQWIQRQLILNEAHNLQLAQQAEIQERLRKAREEVLINGLKDVITSRYAKENNVSEAEALQYYQQNQQRLVLNERYVKIQLVENESLSAVRAARQALQNDSLWSETAHRYSIKPEEKISMSNKYWPVSSLFNNVLTMRRYVTTLDSGQVSPIQREEGIYRFFKVMDVRSQGEQAKPEWFVEELKGWLMREKQRKYYNSYVKNLYFKAEDNNEIELYNVSKHDINDNVDSIDTN